MDTIIGQVLCEVRSNTDNEKYFELLDSLIECVMDSNYFDVTDTIWQKDGLFITNEGINDITKKLRGNWLCVETEYVFEYSWLVEQLVDIYQPDEKEYQRLLNTLGYLLNTYSKKFDDLGEIFRMTIVTSIVFLHPDHLGWDKFKVAPIVLPPFGTEF
jgi:hypothetical protein